MNEQILGTKDHIFLLPVTVSIGINGCVYSRLLFILCTYRDGDEWVRLFASVLAPFPDSQTITLEADSNASEILDEIEESCEFSS